MSKKSFIKNILYQLTVLNHGVLVDGGEKQYRSALVVSLLWFYHIKKCMAIIP